MNPNDLEAQLAHRTSDVAYQRSSPSDGRPAHFHTFTAPAHLTGLTARCPAVVWPQVCGADPSCMAPAAATLLQHT